MGDALTQHLDFSPRFAMRHLMGESLVAGVDSSWKPLSASATLVSIVKALLQRHTVTHQQKVSIWLLS